MRPVPPKNFRISQVIDFSRAPHLSLTTPEELDKKYAWAVLQFETPIFSPLDSVYIASKLDIDVGKLPPFQSGPLFAIHRFFMSRLEPMPTRISRSRAPFDFARGAVEAAYL